MVPSTTKEEYIMLPHSICKVIGIIEVLKDIQIFFISRKYQTPKYCTHSKAFFLVYITPSKINEDNQACINFYTIPKTSPCTKHIALPY